MKKLLLSLVMLISTVCLTSAATGTDWTSAYTTLDGWKPVLGISSTSSAINQWKDTSNGLTAEWTVSYTPNTGACNTDKNGLRFGSSGKPVTEIKFKTSSFANKTVNSVKVHSAWTSGTASTSPLTVTVGGVDYQCDGNSNGLPGTSTHSSGKDLTFTGSSSGEIVITFKVNNKKQAGLKGLTVNYSDGTSSSEKIMLEDGKLVIMAGEKVIEGEEVELDANTELTFSYDTDITNADIVYSYSTDAEKYFEKNSYVFDGNDVTIHVKAISSNEANRKLTITKKYPTECPKPEFSVADGANVYAGQIITVKAEGAEKLLLTANDVDVEGTSYTVAGNPGDQIKLYARASVTGKNSEITNDNTITVNVVEATEATFNFANSGYGLTPQTGNSDYETDVKEIGSGIVKIVFEGETYRYWDSDKTLRVQKTSNFTISVPESYYITGISMTGTSASNVDNGIFESGSWSDGGKLCSSVKFTPTGTTKIKTITVKYAKVPTIENKTIEIAHGKGAGEVIIEYDFVVANHNGHDLVVEASIDGMDYVVFAPVEDTPAPAAAPARVAGEAVISGKLKATHENLKTTEAPISINIKATLDGKELYSDKLNPTTTTGVDDIVADDANAPVEYYNLQGVRVANPENGLYIRVQGKKATKVLVK